MSAVLRESTDLCLLKVDQCCNFPSLMVYRLAVQLGARVKVVVKADIVLIARTDDV
jgi:hypothetical protein